MPGLAERRVLIVEDEIIVAMELERLLLDAGCGAAGHAGSIAEALKVMANDRYDAALLDMNLRGESAAPIADALSAANVPFIVLTGYSHDIIPPRHRHRPILTKPFEPNRVLRTLAGVLDGGRPPEADRPH